MNIISVTAIILTIAIVQGQETILPCRTQCIWCSYKDFVFNHVLNKTFDRKDTQSWER